MSIVLYALGLGLFAWSALMAFGGETYAAIDISANLAGWGAFTIGLGAVTAAIGRVGRIIAEREASPVIVRPEPSGTEFAPLAPVFAAPAAAAAYAPQEPAEAEPVYVSPTSAPRVEATPDLSRDEFRPEPVFEPELRREPQPAREPRFGFSPRFTARREPEIQPPAPAVDLRSEPEPESVPTPEAEPQLTPEPAPQGAASEPEPAPLEEDRSTESEPAELSRSERRAMRIKARQERLAERVEPAIEAPRAVAPPLGGGLVGRRRFGAEPAGQGTDVAEPFALASPERPARPIMPFRPRAEEAPAETADPVEPEADIAESVPELPIEPVAEPTAPVVEPEPAPAPSAEPAAAPKVPEWLARARARRQSRLETAPEPASEPLSEPEPEPYAEPELETPSEPTHAPGPEPDVEPEFKPAPEPEPVTDHAAVEDVVAPSPPEEPAGPQIVREGEHNGVLYRFYDDGSVEAATAHGSRRFASIEELRQTVMAARGPAAIIEAELQPDAETPDVEPEPAPEPEAAPANPDEEPDPLDAALAELEGKIAPEPRLHADDRRGRPGQ